jgi:hypothetical protein
MMETTFALAIAHAGSCALANGLRAVDGQRTVAGSDNLGFGDLFALADDIVAGRSSLRRF